MYRTLYKSVGGHLPPFPERYLTGCLVGRIDLVDVISAQEYLDTIPKPLQEHGVHLVDHAHQYTEDKTIPAFLFVARNPQYLDIPLKMGGAPNIYRLPKEVFYGARDKLQPAPYDWWPPEQYKRQVFGRFDLYPGEMTSWTRDQIIAEAEKSQVVIKPQPIQLTAGCFHLKSLVDAPA